MIARLKRWWGKLFRRQAVEAPRSEPIDVWGHLDALQELLVTDLPAPLDPLLGPVMMASKIEASVAGSLNNCVPHVVSPSSGFVRSHSLSSM